MIDVNEAPSFEDQARGLFREMVQDEMRRMVAKAIKLMLVEVAELHSRRRHAKRYRRMSVRRAGFDVPRRIGAFRAKVFRPRVGRAALAAKR